MPQDTHPNFVHGWNPVFEVLAAERRAVHAVHLNERTPDNQAARRLERILRLRGIPLKRTDKGKLSQMSQSNEHQGVVAAVDPYPYAGLEELLEDARRLLLVDNIEDPRNLGAILRGAEVFGFRRILLPRRGCPGIYPSVVKSSAGATEHLLVCRARSANQYFKIARERGFHTAALDAKGQTILEPRRPPTIPEKLLLVIGGEDKGVGQFILNNADSTLAIPRRGRVTSLNASVAAGLALWCFAPAE